MIDIEKKRVEELFFPLTTARDHLCFLIGLYQKDENCLLTGDDAIRIGTALKEINQVREKVINRSLGND